MPVPAAAAPAAPARRSLRDVCVDRLRDAIMDGTFEPGEVLHDRELQEWLGVSRTPIREALIELARAGLVETSAQRFTRVVTPSDENIRESIQTLGVLLGGVVRLAVPLLSLDDRGETVALIDRVRATIAERDLAAHALAVFDLYYGLVFSCGNPPLIKVCKESIDGLTYRLRISWRGPATNWERLDRLYRDFRDAVLRGDAIDAASATGAIHLLPGSRS